MNLLVSIIIPVFNRPLEFERALLSAFAQDYSNIEIIVVDDGSEDDIESVVNKHRENSPFPIYYFIPAAPVSHSYDLTLSGVALAIIHQLLIWLYTA